MFKRYVHENKALRTLAFYIKMNHHQHEMIKYEKFYECSEFYANCSKSKTRKILSLCKKFRVCEYCATHKNYRETAIGFGLQGSTVRKYERQHHLNWPTKGD